MDTLNGMDFTHDIVLLANKHSYMQSKVTFVEAEKAGVKVNMEKTTEMQINMNNKLTLY